MVCSGDLNQNETVYFIPVGKTVNENYGQFPPLSRFSSYRLFLEQKQRYLDHISLVFRQAKRISGLHNRPF